MNLPHAIAPDTFSLFSEHLAAAGGRATAASSLDDVVAAIAGIAGEGWIVASATTLLPGLVDAMAAKGVGVRLPDDVAAVRDAPLGITAARLAIAETGSVLLHENELNGRSVSLMTQHLVVLCPASALVPSLDEAAPVLREIAHTGPSYATFVTGPSRTADIERELAVGVQGPGELHVIFLTDDIHPSGDLPHAPGHP